MGSITSDELQGLARELFIVGGRMTRAISPVMRNVERGEMFALRALAEAENPLAPGELAETAHISSARVANILASLEAKDWAKREHSQADRRRVTVSLTEAGRAEFERSRKDAFRAAYAFLESFGAKDAHELIRLLNKAAEIIESKKTGVC